MAIFTQEEFRRISQTKAGNKSMFQLRLEAKLDTRSGKTTSIFLSHSHNDKELIEEAVSFFKGLNINIYVDWMDETMPEKPSGATAINIRYKISSNDRFILLATNNAIVSKWCNWELGLGDVFKMHKDKLALLPLADSRGHWTGNEYLQIYPRIESVTKSDNSFYDNIFYLIYPDGSRKWLDDWLKS